MAIFGKKRPSTYLFWLSAAVIGIGFIMLYFTHMTVERLKYDAALINEMGIVRGSIQRAAKLSLSGTGESPGNISSRINRLLDRFQSRLQSYRSIKQEQDIFQHIQNLEQKWRRLENKLAEYADSPSPELRRNIISESEQCWQEADVVVFAAQISNENKVAGIRLLYIIPGLNLISAVAIIFLTAAYVRKKLEFESSHDPLTRLKNRRSYEREIESEVARSKRYDQPLTLIMFDIDHFKQINDKYGHKTGDLTLRTLADIVTESVRKSDSVFRVGGEEFAVIAPQTKADGAFRLSEKIRRKVEIHSFDTVNKMTISIGIKELCPDTTKDELYHSADKALYLAKTDGRNCTRIWTDHPAPAG